ncbi:MAG: SUMF1/EgtB/PvdO family nonheme iron enzyme [Spirochaetales bacterium]|jgi:formylglycine-generating enzyme required for sulfatase activity|nr:SUMF1/EgtB/PvdO family nonheme iron enzyme [Spirochaetales bacterium]
MKKKNIPNNRDARREDSAGADESAIQRVVLPPLLGIQPRVYVAALYALVLAGIFFFVFLYPGVFKPGAEITFTSLPEEASVLVDGLRVGATPVTAFVAEGRHVITLRRPHFGELKLPLIVGGRLFASRFSPLRESFHAELSPQSPAQLLRDAHREFSVWALSGEPNPLYPLPPVLSSAVRDYAAASGAAAAEAQKEIFAMLARAAASVNSPANFRDFISAASLAASGGGAFSPQALLKAAEWFLPLYARNEESLYWLILVLPDKAREELISREWTQARLDELFGGNHKQDAPRTATAGRGTISGSPYVLLPAGTFRLGQAGVSATGLSRLAKSDAQALKRMRESPPFTVQAETGNFFLGAAEVTQAEYAAFLKENPAWLPSGRAALVRQGLVEDTYLASWKDSPAPPEPASPVSEVSFYAAAAYCEWLKGKDSRYDFFLPSEAQWEYAALAAEAAGIKSMRDGVWEWCGDWYAPAAYIFPLSGDFPTAEKVVRGGAWINSAGVNISTRGSQPPEWCSPYVGFRIAAMEKPLKEPLRWKQ